MKNTRFSVRQTERLCTLSSLESSPTNSQKGHFPPIQAVFAFFTWNFTHEAEKVP
jgi:hypothetical protein